MPKSKSENLSKRQSVSLLILQKLAELAEGALSVDLEQGLDDFVNGLASLSYKGARPYTFLHEFKRIEKRQWLRIERADNGPKIRIQITKKALKHLHEAKVNNLFIAKPARWDGLWRFVCFDIPEKHKVYRNLFRAKIKQLGFVQVQKSLWVHPYPCLHEIKIVVAYYKMDDYVSMLEGKYLGDDRPLKRIFKV